MDKKLAIAKLAVSHDPSGFNCGHAELNSYLRLYALAGQRANISQTYVAADDNVIAGYHTLVVGDVVYEDAPERLVKGIPRYPIPVMLLARLAVDRFWQSKKLGAALVTDAIRRSLQVADIVGVRALLVHAKDNDARSFYEHLGFIPFPDEPLVLYRLMKDLKIMRPK
jgi:GNAT superfamily N-acetyltransferase